MGNELTNKQKREWAELLFLQGDITQKEIAHKVNVAEKTISAWAAKYNWDALRKSNLTTKNEILRRLYNVLDKLSTRLDADEGTGDTKDADKFVKYTAAINNLETETSIGQISEVMRGYVNWLQTIDPALALSVVNHADKYIKEKLKRF